MLMLILNYQVFLVAELNLNTSHVNVNLKVHLYLQTPPNLNTSHVNVNQNFLSL